MLGLDLDTPLTQEESREWIDSIAGEIAARRLECPAVLLLEMHKPLSFVASQGLVVALPMIGPLIGSDRIAGLIRLMRERGNIDLLIARIEELAAERDRPQTAEEQG